MSITCQITLYRMVLFFIVLLVGAFCGRKKIITQDSLPNLQKLITKVFLPVLIFYSTYVSATFDVIRENLVIILFAACFYALIFVVLLLLAKIMHLPKDQDKGFIFCFMFGNTLFVGIPLLTALFPEKGMLYIALFSIIDQLVFWTLGIWLATGRERNYKFSLKNFISPNTISLLLVFICIIAGVKLPNILLDSMKIIDSGTGGLCMLYLGALMYFSNWKFVLKQKDLYVGIAVKMLVLPILAGIILVQTSLSNELVTTMVILMSLPVMTVVPMIAKAYGNCGEYAAGVTAITLAVSVITVPFVQFILSLV